MEEHDEKKVTRREAVKLAGIAAALGAGLGISGEADGQGLLQHKGSALQFKFYSIPDAAGKQELLLAVPAPAMLQKKLHEDGQVQIKLTLGSRGQTRLPAVQKVIGEATLQVKIDRALLQDKTRQ